MSSPRLAAGALLIVAVGSSSVAVAGSAKTTRLTDATRARGGAVDLRLDSAGLAISARLAQVAAARTIHYGSCRRRRASRGLILRAAHDLGLDHVAIVSRDPELRDDGGGRPSLYLYEPQTTGAYSAGAASLSLRLVELGIASVNRERGSFRTTFLAAQRTAKAHHRGRWRRC